MLKVIDLDTCKDGEGMVFTLTIGTEKFGVTDQELIELIRTRHGGSGKSGGKRAPQRRGASAETTATNEAASDLVAETEAETPESLTSL